MQAEEDAESRGPACAMLEPVRGGPDFRARNAVTDSGDSFDTAAYLGLRGPLASVRGRSMRSLRSLSDAPE